MKPPSPLRVLVRVDAGASMGWGHGYRCLALTEALVRQGHRVTVLAREMPSGLGRLFRGTGASLRWSRAKTSEKDGEATARTAQGIRAQWVVTDGYKFDASFYERLRFIWNGSVMIFDDTAKAARYPAEIVLNHNPPATNAWYKDKQVEGRVLAGSPYLQLREEFRKPLPRSRSFQGRVLVTLGGTDPRSLTRKILRALGACRRVRSVTVLSRRKDILKGVEKGTVRFFQESKPGHIRRWMDWADAAVAGAGTTAWELAARGVPSFLVLLADNQKPVVKALVERGAAIHLKNLARNGISRALDRWTNPPLRLARLGQNGRTVADGRGPERVVRVLEESTLVLRRAGRGDVQKIWRWANDPEARRVSFRQDAIPWTAHVAWYRQRLKSPKTRFWVGETRTGRPVGQVRFDAHRPGVARVSVSVDSRERHRGWGRMLVGRGTRLFLKKSPRVRTVEALIKRGNRPSIKTFERAGYVPAGALKEMGPAVLRYRFSRRRGDSK